MGRNRSREIITNVINSFLRPSPTRKNAVQYPTIAAVDHVKKKEQNLALTSIALPNLTGVPSCETRSSGRSEAHGDSPPKFMMRSWSGARSTLVTLLSPVWIRVGVDAVGPTEGISTYSAAESTGSHPIWKRVVSSRIRLVS